MTDPKREIDEIEKENVEIMKTLFSIEKKSLASAAAAASPNRSWLQIPQLLYAVLAVLVAVLYVVLDTRLATTRSPSSLAPSSLSDVVGSPTQGSASVQTPPDSRTTTDGTAPVNPSPRTTHSYSRKRRKQENEEPPIDINSYTGGWLQDEGGELSYKAGLIDCDLPRHNVDDDMFDPDAINYDAPFILQNRMHKWGAMKNWKRADFIKRFGFREIQTGSQAAVVYNAGESSVPMPLKDYVVGMRNVYNDKMQGKRSVPGQPNTSQDFIKRFLGEDSFTFDVFAAKSLVGLDEDFEIPPEFEHWHLVKEGGGDAKATTKKKQMLARQRGIPANMIHETTTVLSLGPHASGLPFHTHARAWLGLVHGRKWWFLYPPSAGMPPVEQATFNPMHSVLDWVKTVRPRLSRYAKAPLNGKATSQRGYRPLECVQQPGDIMYLPDLWSHQTINVGEAVAIGGQMGMFVHERMEWAERGMKLNPVNLELLKHTALANVGLGQVEKAMVLLQKAHLLAPLDLSIPLMQLHSLQAQGKVPEMHAIVQKIEGLLDKMDTTKVTSYSLCVMYSLLASKMRGFGMHVGDVSYNVRNPMLLEKALAANPDCLPALLERAHVSSAKSDIDGFNRDVDHVLRMSPNHKVALALKEQARQYRKEMQ